MPGWLASVALNKPPDLRFFVSTQEMRGWELSCAFSCWRDPASGGHPALGAAAEATGGMEGLLLNAPESARALCSARLPRLGPLAGQHRPHLAGRHTCSRDPGAASPHGGAPVDPAPSGQGP